MPSSGVRDRIERGVCLFFCRGEVARGQREKNLTPAAKAQQAGMQKQRQQQAFNSPLVLGYDQRIRIEEKAAELLARKTNRKVTNLNHSRVLPH